MKAPWPGHSIGVMRLVAIGTAFMFVLAACAAPTPAGASSFETWLAIAPDRRAAFERFEALLVEEGVADVLPARDLWLVDQIRPACTVEPYVAPPEEEWRNLVPTLRFIRDHVEPAIGEVRVVSGYRDATFNDCIGGASRSAHRSYFALDLMPMSEDISRADLISLLCPIHETAGRRGGIGLGIYSARRFHIDARSYRGWGDDHRSASFPCVTER